MIPKRENAREGTLRFLLPRSLHNFLTRESPQPMGTLPAFLKWVSLPGFSIDLVSVPPALVPVTSTCHAQTHMAISLPAAKSSGDFCVSILFDFSGAPNTADCPSFWKLLLASLTSPLPGPPPTWPCLLHFSFLWPTVPQNPGLALVLLLSVRTPRPTS